MPNRPDIEVPRRPAALDAADTDPGKPTALVLAVLRGMEALGKAGASEETLTGTAGTALAVLPRPAEGG